MTSTQWRHKGYGLEARSFYAWPPAAHYVTETVEENVGE